MFNINNYWIEDILKFIIRDKASGDIIGILTETSQCNIKINTTSKELHNRRGEIVDIQYLTKDGDLTVTNAFLSTAIQNLGSGVDFDYASAESTINMPKISTVAPGSTIYLENPVEGTILVEGIYPNSSLAGKFTMSTEASLRNMTYKLRDENVLTVPAYELNSPSYYVVVYRRRQSSGMRMRNPMNKFPSAVTLDIVCSYTTPCGDSSACYLYVPCFQPSPEMEINLDIDNRELDFTGKLMKDKCGNDENLYVLYFPEGETVEVDGYAPVANQIITTEDLEKMWKQDYTPSGEPMSDSQVLTIPELEQMWNHTYVPTGDSDSSALTEEELEKMWS